MTLPDRDGRFRAYPVEWGVAQTGPNNLITFTCRWKIVQWYGEKEKEWFDYSQQDAEITSYSYIQKRDGNVNESAVEQLRDALGWDGRDIEALSNTDWTERGCSIVCAWDQYQGKTKLKVEWIDTWDSTSGGAGGIKKADASGLSQMQASFGGQLRAISPAKADSAALPASAPAPAPPPSSAKDVPESSIPF